VEKTSKFETNLKQKYYRKKEQKKRPPSFTFSLQMEYMSRKSITLSCFMLITSAFAYLSQKNNTLQDTTSTPLPRHSWSSILTAKVFTEQLAYTYNSFFRTTTWLSSITSEVYARTHRFVLQKSLKSTESDSSNPSTTPNNNNNNTNTTSTREGRSRRTTLANRSSIRSPSVYPYAYPGTSNNRSSIVPAFGSPGLCTSHRPLPLKQRDLRKSLLSSPNQIYHNLGYSTTQDQCGSSMLTSSAQGYSSFLYLESPNLDSTQQSLQNNPNISQNNLNSLYNPYAPQQNQYPNLGNQQAYISYGLGDSLMNSQAGQQRFAPSQVHNNGYGLDTSRHLDQSNPYIANAYYPAEQNQLNNSLINSTLIVGNQNGNFGANFDTNNFNPNNNNNNALNNNTFNPNTQNNQNNSTFFSRHNKSQNQAPMSTPFSYTTPNEDIDRFNINNSLDSTISPLPNQHNQHNQHNQQNNQKHHNPLKLDQNNYNFSQNQGNNISHNNSSHFPLHFQPTPQNTPLKNNQNYYNNPSQNPNHSANPHNTRTSFPSSSPLKLNGHSNGSTISDIRSNGNNLNFELTLHHNSSPYQTPNEDYIGDLASLYGTETHSGNTGGQTQLHGPILSTLDANNSVYSSKLRVNSQTNQQNTTMTTTNTLSLPGTPQKTRPGPNFGPNQTQTVGSSIQQSYNTPQYHAKSSNLVLPPLPQTNLNGYNGNGLQNNSNYQHYQHNNNYQNNHQNDNSAYSVYKTTSNHSSKTQIPHRTTPAAAPTTTATTATTTNQLPYSSSSSAVLRRRSNSIPLVLHHGDGDGVDTNSQNSETVNTDGLIRSPASSVMTNDTHNQDNVNQNNNNNNNGFGKGFSMKSGNFGGNADQSTNFGPKKVQNNNSSTGLTNSPLALNSIRTTNNSTATTQHMSQGISLVSTNQPQNLSSTTTTSHITTSIGNNSSILTTQTSQLPISSNRNDFSTQNGINATRPTHNLSSHKPKTASERLNSQFVDFSLFK
jgi:hypothetical protein